MDTGDPDWVLPGREAGSTWSPTWLAVHSCDHGLSRRSNAGHVAGYHELERG